MEPSRGWERNKAQTRLSLVRAAARLFRENGYEATTVDDIALTAGCSARTFFRYFGAKEDVLFVDTAEMIADFKKLVGSPIPGLTRWDQIQMGLATTARRMAQPNSGVEENVIAIWIGEPAIAKRLNEIVAELERAMAEALAAERGVDPDTDLSIQLMARGAIAGYLSVLHVHVHTGRDLEELLDDALHLVETRTVPFHVVNPMTVAAPNTTQVGSD